MSNLLNGNFKTKKEVKVEVNQEGEENLQDKLKQAALNSIGGSMVYVERTELTWNGDEEK